MLQDKAEAIAKLIATKNPKANIYREVITDIYTAAEQSGFDAIGIFCLACVQTNWLSEKW